ncbi:MAG: glycosyltransferase family 1 protein [Psychrobium sp.]|nr:glycosyltransferase family 1 protein [Psychrobium sp.]
MQKSDLVVFGEDWGGLPSSTQQLISHIAIDRRVIWVNSIGLRQPTCQLKDLKRVWAKLGQLIFPSKETKRTNRQFLVANVKTIPAPTSAIVRYLTSLYLSYQLKKLMRQQHIVAPILWISLPTAVDVVGRLNESAVVYYCCDDFNALAGVDHHTVSQREQQLVKCADLIITSSDVLALKFPNKNTEIVPHGVDYQLFSTPVPRAKDLPSNKPIAGYYGSISSWIDLELLSETIAQMPQWNFVFIGDICVDVSVLTCYSNVYFLGRKEHNKLPCYSQHWQASLLPFRDNNQIKACNPFKLREYLATGKPIISTYFPALRPYKSLIEVVSNASQMIAALTRVSSQPVYDARKPSAVAHQTWQARAAKINQLMERL